MWDSCISSTTRPPGRRCRVAPDLARESGQLAGGHVRGVRDHDVEALVRADGVPEVAGPELDRGIERQRVLPGDGEGVLGDVGRDDRGAPLERERHPEHAGAGAEVERGAALGQGRERGLGDELRLRARHEDPCVHRERAAVELLAADQVGGRFTVGSPADELAVRRELRLAERLVEVEVEPDAIAPQRRREQHLGGEPRGIDPLLREEVLGPGEELDGRPDVRHARFSASAGSPFAASRSAWAAKKVRQASTTSWTSPSITAGRLWRV